jgi:hypothetical protein
MGKHLRPTADGPGSHVLVLTTFPRRNDGQRCEVCGSVWTIEKPADAPPIVRRNGEEEPAALLNWTGNNAAVECCRVRR